MITEYLARMMARDVRAIRREIEAYGREEDLWKKPPGVPNAAGNLALHCAGNLRHFIGAQLGGTGYVRDRPAEFAARGVPRGDLLASLDDAVAAVQKGLAAARNEDLGKTYPLEVGGHRLAIGDFVIHLATHLAFHFGQMDYHRRLVTGDARSVDPVAVGELASAAPGGGS